jgi:glycosyltransferase involved in cell wall biosynthesis
VVYPGLNLKSHGGGRIPGPPTIGYFARICPEKGFQNLVDAFINLRQTKGAPAAQLRVAGWMGDHHKRYFADQISRLERAGLASEFSHVECPDLASKVQFFRSIDVLSVPTTYREPKGLYVLEAWANGVPVVQPRHGSFPELIEATGGGQLVEPGNPADLATALARVLKDPVLRAELGRRGLEGVQRRFTARHMAENTAAVLSRLSPDTRLQTSRATLSVS